MRASCGSTVVSVCVCLERDGVCLLKCFERVSSESAQSVFLAVCLDCVCPCVTRVHVCETLECAEPLKRKHSASLSHCALVQVQNTRATHTRAPRITGAGLSLPALHSKPTCTSHPFPHLYRLQRMSSGGGGGKKRRRSGSARKAQRRPRLSRSARPSARTRPLSRSSSRNSWTCAARGGRERNGAGFCGRG